MKREPDWNKIKQDYREEYFEKKKLNSLWRKNPKGFYNFVCYIQPDQDILELIKKDYYEQKAKKKQKKNNLVDDDI